MSEQYSPGLAGVIAGKSTIGLVNGTDGILLYRGYPVEELAEHCTFEEVAHLLLVGHLPTQAELTAFDAELKARRVLPAGLIEILRNLPTTTHPMAALQVGTAALSGFFPALDAGDKKGNWEGTLRLTASLPTIVAAFHRIRQGKPVVAPDTSLGLAADFLSMLNGEKPDAKSSRLFDVCLVLHAEHGFNASTFTGRVVGSSLADIFASMAAAVGSLSGPLHGGANEEVLTQLNTISSAAEAPAWLDHMIETKQKIMGLGHRVYKVKDPRADILQRMASDLFSSHGSTPLYDIAHAIEDHAKVKLGPKGIWPNVDFYSGLVYQKLGLTVDLFTPIFAIARIAGWSAHWLEQMQDNRIFRPDCIYSGPHGVKVTPLDERG
ncbi:MAG: citrate synthase [Myxococcales bacterium]|nr:citrate synthase [Myxococcales bacterium]